MRTVWKKGSIEYDRTKIMGILNVTPDSFSDGGKHLGYDAIKYALEMIDDGADIIDIGGESTRPGFVPITAEEEILRIVPIIKELTGISSVPISVDTIKPAVAKAAIDAGAHIINDVGGSSEDMMRIVHEHGAAMVIMHIPADIKQVHNTFMQGDIIPQIISFFNEKTASANNIGISSGSIILDPGIGFGKTMEQNHSILMNTDRFSDRFPILIGASRKRFLATSFNDMGKEDASIEAAKTAASKGAAIVRVHDVKRTVDALRHL